MFKSDFNEVYKDLLEVIGHSSDLQKLKQTKVQENTGLFRDNWTKRQAGETIGRQHERVAMNGTSYLRKAENREEWRRLVVKSTVVPQRSARLQDR